MDMASSRSTALQNNAKEIEKGGCAETQPPSLEQILTYFGRGSQIVPMKRRRMTPSDVLPQKNRNAGVIGPGVSYPRRSRAARCYVSVVFHSHIIVPAVADVN